MLPLAAAVLAPAAFRARQRRRRLAAVADGGPAAAAAAWQEVLAESTDRGVPAPPTDTVRGAARRVVREHRLDPDAQQAMRQLVGAIEASWYGGLHPGAAELAAPVRTVSAGIAAGSPLPLARRLWPRSLRFGRPARRVAANPDSTTAAPWS